MINTQKQKLIFYSMVSLTLSLATGVKGETADIKKPELVLSNVIPVVKKEIEIKIANADSIKEEAVFSITREGKDIVKEKKYGDKITLRGNLNIEEVLAFGTPDDVRRKARHLIDTVGCAGGYILASSHSITEAIPPDNYRAMVEIAWESGY